MPWGRLTCRDHGRRSSSRRRPAASRRRPAPASSRIHSGRSGAVRPREGRRADGRQAARRRIERSPASWSEPMAPVPPPSAGKTGARDGLHRRRRGRPRRKRHQAAQRDDERTARRGTPSQPWYRHRRSAARWPAGERRRHPVPVGCGTSGTRSARRPRPSPSRPTGRCAEATMISTMPPRSMPTDAVCCAMLYRFSGDRKLPVRTWKAIAITASTPAMIDQAQVERTDLELARSDRRWRVRHRRRRPGATAVRCSPGTAILQAVGATGRATPLQAALVFDVAGLDRHVEVVRGHRHRLEEDRIHLTFFSPSAQTTAPSTFLPPGQRHRRRVAAFAAEVARVLPHRHRLRAERDAVQRRVVAVLARTPERPSGPWRRQRRDHPAGHAVVRGDDRVDLVLVLGQDLLHVLLARPQASSRRYSSPTILMSPS